MREDFFFTLHEVLPSEMLICSLVHLRWVGLQDRRVSLNSTKATVSSLDAPASGRANDSTDCSFLLASSGCTEKNLHCDLGVCPPYADAVFKVQSIEKGEQWILRANTVRDQSEHPS